MEMTEITETTRRGFVTEKRGSEMEMTETARRGFVFLSLSNPDKKIRYYQEDGVANSSFPDSQMEFVSSGVPTMTLSKIKKTKKSIQVKLLRRWKIKLPSPGLYYLKLILVVFE
ncbi:hypothetical protein IGI04_007529, partial [Brassica rapa subsp. trilocularis]